MPIYPIPFYNALRDNIFRALRNITPQYSLQETKMYIYMSVVHFQQIAIKREIASLLSNFVGLLKNQSGMMFLMALALYEPEFFDYLKTFTETRFCDATLAQDSEKFTAIYDSVESSELKKEEIETNKNNATDKTKLVLRSILVLSLTIGLALQWVC